MNITSVVLAAGFSSRAGVFKMTLPFKGKTVLECCIDSLSEISNEVIVVTGFKHDAIEQLLTGKENVTLVYNNKYEEGMFSSLKEGLRNVKGDRFFLIPGDYPSISEETYEALVGLNGEVCIPTYKGRKGHPILINSEHIYDILNNSMYSSLRDFVHSQRCSFIEVEDEGILNDIDTYDEYLKLLDIS